MTRKQKRLAVISGGIGFLVAAVLLVMFAFSQSIAYFYVPGDLAKANVAPGTRIRLGGLVESGTVKRGEGSTVTFTVTDTSTSGASACTRSLASLRKFWPDVSTNLKKLSEAPGLKPMTKLP